MSRGLAVVGLAASLCSAGCVSYRPKPLSARDRAEAYAARSLTDGGLHDFMVQSGRGSGSWPPASWSLESLTLAAWYYHPEMATARAQVTTAEAAIQSAKERPEPTVGFSPQFTSNPGGLSPWTLGYSLDLPLETAGKRAKRTAVATAQASSVRYQLAVAAWKVRSRVRSSLLSLWQAREAVTLAAQQEKDQVALADLLDRRYAAGEIGLAEILPQRVAAGQDRLAMQEARKQERLAVAALARAIGVSETALADCTVDFVAITRIPSESMPGETQLRQWALQGRPDLLSALADYAVAEASLKLEIARQYPDLNLGPGYTWDQGADRWSLGISLTLPVFNRNRGAIARAEADRSSAAARFDAVQTGALAELESARTNYLASRESEKMAEEVFARQNLQLSSAAARLHAGENGRVEWLGSRIIYDNAAIARLSAVVQVQESLGALEDSIQRPLDETDAKSPNP